MKSIRYREDDGKVNYLIMLSAREFALINLALSIAIDYEKVDKTRQKMEELLYSEIEEVSHIV